MSVVGDLSEGDACLPKNSKKISVPHKLRPTWLLQCQSFVCLHGRCHTQWCRYVTRSLTDSVRVLVALHCVASPPSYKVIVKWRYQSSDCECRRLVIYCSARLEAAATLACYTVGFSLLASLCLLYPAATVAYVLTYTQSSSAQFCWPAVIITGGKCVLATWARAGEL